MKDLSKNLDSLSHEERELLEAYFQEAPIEHNKGLSSFKVERDTNRFELSSSQERLWFLDQLKSGNISNQLFFAFVIKGKLNREYLEKSFNKILQRHEILRTSFVASDGKPFQIINESVEFKIKVEDASHINETDLDEINRLASIEAEIPFDLSMPPLMRVKLLNLQENVAIFFMTIHHIISDGWSIAVLFKELNVFYNNFKNNSDINLEELPLQFVDFSYWQKNNLKSKQVEKQIEYWKDKLSGNLPVVDLPSDKPRPMFQSYVGSKYYFEFPKELVKSLKTLGSNTGCTVYMILLAGFQSLIHRYTEADDIIVGSPIANRNHHELEILIGAFLNILVYRTDFSGDPTFKDILKRIREVTLEAYSNQDVPFEKLVEILQPVRDLSRSPLFNFMIQYSPKLKLELPDVELADIHFNSKTSQYDLTIHVYEEKDRLSGFIEYNSDLFYKSTIERFFNHLQNLLKSVAADPDKPVSDLMLLSDAENKILNEWNNTQKDFGVTPIISKLFEKQVKKTPNNVAIKFEDKILTYAEFEAKANKLAHRLIKEGVKAEVPVGIYMERSIEMMVAIYGILKAGGAYLPLDPDYPDDRISFMTVDADLKIILTQDRFKKRILNKSIKIFYLDSEWDIINAESPHKPEVQINENDLAYIIYTSGSTGMPKGVMNVHKGICNRLLWMDDEYRLDETDVVLQKTPFSFDVSVWEFFWPLLTGASLVIAKPDGHKDSGYLTEIIQSEGITTIHFVPSMLQIFLDNPNIKSCKSLRHVFCSGEALTESAKEKFFDNLNAKLHNLYGPTEAAVDVTYYECSKSDKLNNIPIGKPIANTKIFILDSYLNKLPIGVPGEIHIGGINLARGYLNRKELTEEKFIENPYGIGRLYKTGDKGRYKEDGNIEFLGRLDFQVKVRGYRIELGEIEAILDQHHDVKESVVITRNDYSDDTKIVAYLVTDTEEIDSNKLKIFLSLKLPEYMIPNLFMKIESIPLTSSGKVNRNALPEPDFSANVLESNFQAARDELELQLVKIWEKVLGIKSIGIRDNFFSLGGHSLLAAQLFNLIEKNMGKKIPIVTLFQAPTVEKLAAIIHQEDWKPNWSSLIPIQPGGSKPPLFLVHGAEGYVLFYHKIAEYLGKDQPVYGLQAVGLYNKDKSHKSLEEMASHYIQEIKKLQPEGPYYLGGYCLGGTIAFEIAQQLKKQQDQVALLALLETYNIKSREKSLTLLEQLQYKFENLTFHLENLLMLNSKDKVKFFNQKFAVSKSRFKLKLKKIFNFNSHQQKKDEAIDSDLTIINEKAQACYNPNIYNGNVTLFRPKKGFSGYDFATFGWQELAQGGVNIEPLNVNPRGMLVEPFVQELAEKLKNSIDKASKQKSMN